MRTTSSPPESERLAAAADRINPSAVRPTATTTAPATQSLAATADVVLGYHF